MPNYSTKKYVKDLSFDPIYNTVNKSFLFKTRILPGIFMASGFLILGTQVAYPLLYFKTHEEIYDPVVTGSVLGVAAGFSSFEFRELETTNSKANASQQEESFFYITIDKLGIKDAAVEINAKSLKPDLALGHYKGSALPGNVGNTFIYGHSVLPWFFNAKNYKTIFSTLDKLDTGDTIKVKVKDKEYIYKVESLEVLPVDKVQPLAEFKPKYLNESTMVLMTCWPAGTKSKRLLVKTVLI